MRVLIADDDRGNAAIVRSMLERWGLETVVVHDGLSAWTTLEQDPTFSAAILDWMMPGTEGPELCRRLRAEERLAQLYVIILTSRDSRADLVAAIDGGADDYLIKPFDPDELRVRLKSGLRVAALQQRLSERIRQLEEAASKIQRLQGMLPICSYCKNVRTDDDYWEQVEDYVSLHSDLQFSHGICPKCYTTVLAEHGLTNEG